MPAVTLRYSVPVYVDVDVEAGTVRHVSIGDEMIYGGDQEGEQPYSLEAEDEKVVAAAVKIADESIWPAWSFD